MITQVQITADKMKDFYYEFYFERSWFLVYYDAK